MNGFPFISPAPVLIDIGQDQLRLIHGERGFEIGLERHPGGRLTEPCRQRLESELRDFLRPKAWQPRRRAVCAIGARGVSLRRLKIPQAAPDQQQRLLRLQVESEFPLPPDQLAWGALAGNGTPACSDADPHTASILVFAVRRELIHDYRTVLQACNLDPVFTLAALARAQLCPLNQERCALLDVQSRDSELVVFDRGAPAAIHCLAWGAQALCDSPGNVSTPDVSLIGNRLWVSGGSARGPGSDEIRGALSLAVGVDIIVEPLPVMPQSPHGAVLQGLQRLTEHGRRSPPLVLQTDLDSTRSTSAINWRSRWALAAAVLALGVLVLRLVETSLERTRLSRAIERVRSYRESLPLIDQQLGFLTYLQTNRLPYLRVVAAVAQSASPGMQIESISLNRRGDLLLRGTLQGQQPPTAFRTKLVESGAFSSVVLEEQSPGQDQQRITFRIAARWDPETVRNLPELPPVESRPTGFGPPGVPMPPNPSFEGVMPMPSGALPPGISLPPGVTLPPGMEMPTAPGSPIPRPGPVP